MKILFLNPPSPDTHTYYRDTNRSGRRSKAGELWPQAGLAQFAALYPDHEVKIIDCIAEGMPYSKLNAEMQRFQPDWVFFNPVSCTITSDMYVAYMAKKLGAKTAAISPHLKATDEQYQYLDHTIHHEKPIKEGHFVPEAEYKLRELITGESSARTTFEDLPPARQDLLPIQRYSMPFIGSGYTAIIASRGCPYACIYCRTTVATERKIRYRRVESVIEEIRKYRLTNFILHGDTMTLNKPWIYEFCKRVRSLPFKVRIVSNSRVDSVDFDLLKEMKSAGWWMISYGCESGDDRVLALNKKEATVEQARKAVRWAKEAGLKVWFYAMLGMYGDSAESMQRTIDLACDTEPDIANFSVSAPYVGTEWHSIANEKRWIKDSNWSSFDQNYSAQVDQPGCSRDLVRQFQRKAYFQWYFSKRGLKFFFNSFKPEYFNYFFKAAKAHIFG